VSDEFIVYIVGNELNTKRRVNDESGDPIFLRLNFLKKIIEVIKKGTHLFKVIIINLPRMKKSNEICG
jgi:hypothetical protein